MQHFPFCCAGVFSFLFLVLSSLHWLWVSMVLKSITISTVLISSFQPHKALDKYEGCNFQFYSVVRLRIYLSNHKAEKLLLTGNKSVNLNTVAFTQTLSETPQICRQAYLIEVPKISEGYFSSLK